MSERKRGKCEAEWVSICFGRGGTGKASAAISFCRNHRIGYIKSTKKRPYVQDPDMALKVVEDSWTAKGKFSDSDKKRIGRAYAILSREARCDLLPRLLAEARRRR